MFGPGVRARFSIYDLFGPFSNGKTLQWTHFTQGTNLIRRGWSRVLHPQQVYICHVVTPESIVKNHRRHLLQIHNDLGNTRLKGLYKLIDRKITRRRGGPQITGICFWLLEWLLFCDRPYFNHVNYASYFISCQVFLWKPVDHLDCMPWFDTTFLSMFHCLDVIPPM